MPVDAGGEMVTPSTVFLFLQRGSCHALEKTSIPKLSLKLINFVKMLGLITSPIFLSPKNSIISIA